MAVVKKISELTPKGANLANNDLLIVGVDNGTDYDLKSVTGAELLSTAVSQTITNGVTTSAPSQNAVYDALDLKVDKIAGSRLITSAEGTVLGNTSGTNSGDETVTTIKSKLGITTLSGSNTGDQNLQQVTDLGNTTNNSLTSNIGYFTKTLTNQTLSVLYSNTEKTEGQMRLSDLLGNQTYFKINEITYNSNSILFPNNAGTLALTSDLTSKVDSNAAITGATKTKITYDSKGLVTAGADATTSDIADSSNKRYVTDAQLTVLGNTSGTNTGDQIISDATITTSDITTNNVSITKHGFVPKAPNNTTQYLRGDGTWATPSAGGLTYFTEAQSTASPNATVNVDSLTAVASTTNADFVVRPKGTGAILGRIPDNTGTGGNKRGINAVDLQTFIDQPDQVASGNYSVVVGGQGNKASAINTSVLGGYYNNATGQYSTVIGGFGNSSIGTFSVTGGRDNVARGQDVMLGEGCSTVSSINYNTASGYYNVITSGYHSTAFGGYNSLNGQYHFAGGESNTLTAPYGSAVLGINCLDNGYSRFVYGNQGWVKGDTQSSKIVLNRRTTNATPTPLIIQTPNGSGEATNNQLTLKDNNSIRFKGTIIARQSGSTNTAAWDIDGIIQRGTSAATTTLLISNVNVVQNTPVWGTPTLTANTTLGCLTVTVTGAATTNIQWTCAIDTTEVIYA